MTIAELERLLNTQLDKDWIQTLPSTSQSTDALLKAFLTADLRKSTKGHLREGWQTAQRLEGRLIFQVNEVVDIAAPARDRYKPGTGKRCLKLFMTDGAQEVLAMELKPVAALRADLPAGCKVAITHPLVMRGMLMLLEHSVQLLGGLVAELEAARQRLVEHWNKPLGCSLLTVQVGRTQQQQLADARAAAWPDPNNALAQPGVAAPPFQAPPQALQGLPQGQQGLSQGGAAPAQAAAPQPPHVVNPAARAAPTARPIAGHTVHAVAMRPPHAHAAHMPNAWRPGAAQHTAVQPVHTVSHAQPGCELTRPQQAASGMGYADAIHGAGSGNYGGGPGSGTGPLGQQQLRPHMASGPQGGVRLSATSAGTTTLKPSLQHGAQGRLAPIQQPRPSANAHPAPHAAHAPPVTTEAEIIELLDSTDEDEDDDGGGAGAVGLLRQNMHPPRATPPTGARARDGIAPLTSLATTPSSAAVDTAMQPRDCLGGASGATLAHAGDLWDADDAMPMSEDEMDEGYESDAAAAAPDDLRFGLPSAGHPMPLTEAANGNALSPPRSQGSALGANTISVLDLKDLIDRHKHCPEVLFKMRDIRVRGLFAANEPDLFCQAARTWHWPGFLEVQEGQAVLYVRLEPRWLTDQGFPESASIYMEQLRQAQAASGEADCEILDELDEVAERLDRANGFTVSIRPATEVADAASVKSPEIGLVKEYSDLAIFVTPVEFSERAFEDSED